MIGAGIMLLLLLLFFLRVLLGHGVPSPLLWCRFLFIRAGIILLLLPLIIPVSMASFTFRHAKCFIIRHQCGYGRFVLQELLQASTGPSRSTVGVSMGAGATDRVYILDVT